MMKLSLVAVGVAAVVSEARQQALFTDNGGALAMAKIPRV